VQFQETLVVGLNQRFEAFKLNPRYDLFPSCRFDQDAAHGLSGGREKVATVRELLTAHQSQVRFMDQRGRLERLPGLLLCQLLGGKLAQLVVDQRQQLLGRMGIALLDGGQDVGNITHRRHRTGESLSGTISLRSYRGVQNRSR